MLHKHILPKQPKGSKKGQVMLVQVPTVTRYAIIHFNDTHNPKAQEHCITEIKFGISSGMRDAVKKGLVKFKKSKRKRPKKYRHKKKRQQLKVDKVYAKIKGKKKYKGKPKWIKLKYGIEADDLYERGISGFTDHMDFCTGNIAAHALASSKNPEFPETAVGHFTLKGGRYITARYDTVVWQNPANPGKFNKKKIKPFTKTADLINVFDIHAGGKYHLMDRHPDPGMICWPIDELKLYPKKK